MEIYIEPSTKYGRGYHVRVASEIEKAESIIDFRPYSRIQALHMADKCMEILRRRRDEDFQIHVVEAE